jgi:hypothetical protein
MSEDKKWKAVRGDWNRVLFTLEIFKLNTDVEGKSIEMRKKNSIIEMDEIINY